jgi:hypothetical protein
MEARNPSTGGRGFAVALAIVMAVLTATTAPWWWDYLFARDRDGLVGGCEPFNLYAQNQFDPLGAKIWAEPSPTADSSHGFAPNELLTVDGWVRTRSPYPSNPAPWDSDAWFHLANGAGWVSYAGVRADPTDPSTAGNFGEGSSPAPLDPVCAGSYRR